MRGLKTLTAVLLGVVLLGTASPASAKKVAYKHYIACGLSDKAHPSHSCSADSDKGAFFKSVKADVKYTVCVKFPSGKNICARQQKALKGTLYVNQITSTIPGRHQITWFVGGKQVGVSAFKVTESK